jgi:hypothetical protein
MIMVTAVALVAFIGSLFFPTFRYLHKPDPEDEPRAADMPQTARPQ